MAAYADLQEREFASEADGYTATKHQREVGAGYFDDVTRWSRAGESTTTALHRVHRGGAVPLGSGTGPAGAA